MWKELENSAVFDFDKGGRMENADQLSALSVFAPRLADAGMI